MGQGVLRELLPLWWVPDIWATLWGDSWGWLGMLPALLLVDPAKGRTPRRVPSLAPARGGGCPAHL